MTKLDAALLKLGVALDYTVDPQVRKLIDIAQQSIEVAKHVMEETASRKERFPSATYSGVHLSASMEEGIGSSGWYQRAA